MHSSTALCALDLRKCAQAHVTALKTHGTMGEVMAARATWALQANEACARLHPLGSSIVCSITPSALERTGRG
jgi:hypothetical protein